LRIAATGEIAKSSIISRRAAVSGRSTPGEIMLSEFVGRMGRTVVTRLEKNEDLLKAIRNVVSRHDIRAGVVHSITGSLVHAVLQKFVEGQKIIGLIELDGQMEISGHGIVGKIVSPETGKRPFGVGRYVDGEPYVHVHITVQTPTQTVCGHLMEGCLVRSVHEISHFTIMVSEIEGVELRMRGAPGEAGGLYHELVPIDMSAVD
jgi:predicted DNA-binding protein with PD1-like motif